MPSSHPIFTSEYLLSCIFSEYHPSTESSHLAIAATVSKLWSQVALPILWEDMHIEPLPETLGPLQSVVEPGSELYKFKEFNPEALPRFILYALMIQRITWEDFYHEPILAVTALLYSGKINDVFPRLRAVYTEPHLEFPNFLFAYQILLSSRIEQIDIGLEKCSLSSLVVVNNFFKMLQDHCPAVKRLMITKLPSHISEMTGAFTRFITNCRALTSVYLPTAWLDEGALRALEQLAGLESLQIHDDKLNVEYPGVIFDSRLRSANRYHDIACRWIDGGIAPSPKLTKLQWLLESSATGEFFTPFHPSKKLVIELIPRGNQARSMLKLSENLTSAANVGVMFLQPSPVEDDNWGTADLEQLSRMFSACENLHHLNLAHPYYLDLNDDDFIHLAKCWPRIENIRISIQVFAAQIPRERH